MSFMSVQGKEIMFDPRDWHKRILIIAMRNVAPICLPAKPWRLSAREIQTAAYSAFALKGEQFLTECLRLTGRLDLRGGRATRPPRG
jgi:hypothetical protein